MARPDLSIGIPFYNEEGNTEIVLESLIKSLDKEGIDFEIIALNNGSTDGTGKILDSVKDRRVRVFRIRVNKGYGNGIIECYRHMNGKIVGHMWGDNEIPASAVAQIYKKLINEKLDLCKIRRDLMDYNLVRRIQSEVYNKIVMMLLFGRLPLDINGCPKLMRSEAYRKMRLVSKDAFIDTEIILEAKRHGLKTGDVPAKYSKRKKGKSSVSFFIFAEFIRNIINYRLKRWKQHQK